MGRYSLTKGFQGHSNINAISSVFPPVAQTASSSGYVIPSVFLLSLGQKALN